MLQQESHDLVDFCIGRNQSLWLTCENLPVVLSAWLEFDLKTEQQLCWMPVSVEPQVSRTADYGSSNPQEAYLKEIFIHHLLLTMQLVFTTLTETLVFLRVRL
ncbi:hypothetical protein AVEN_76484-1 [Araneus ventricosus]|uniref:Uncharacterized protein n=1 Tax=Araneus ventricosus TaxID=182803 RepID=A0A4Y2CDD8_ARAVE|nr:hypothetical protein AVEN_76484-1 [Araneus ventricosus]